MNESFETALGTPQNQAVTSLRELVNAVPMCALAELVSKSPNAPPMPSLELNYFGTKVLVGSESTDSEVQASLDNALAAKREAYAASIAKAANPRVERFEGQPGERVSCSVLIATQRAQKMHAKFIAAQSTEAVRYVFEFNGIEVNFNPFEAAELVTVRAIEALRAKAAEYENSAEYAASLASSVKKVAALQSQERLLRESVDEVVKKPLAEIVAFVRKYGECADHSGVTTDPQAIVAAFAQGGFQSNAFTGLAFEHSSLSPLETRTRYWIGQFLKTLTAQKGLPPVFFSMGEDLSKAYTEEATA